MNKIRMTLPALLTGFIASLWALNVCAGPSADFIVDGKLAPCPSTPNCVSSQAADQSQVIKPLAVPGDLTEQNAALLKVIADMPRTEIKAQSDNYLWVTFTTLIMRYVDDVEFILAEGEPIAVRSASRVGHSDLGTNRRRVGNIRDALTALEKPDQ